MIVFFSGLSSVSVSIIFPPPSLTSSSSLPALFLPPCPCEPLSVCKPLAWLRYYLKLCHKLCCQTNRLALGQLCSVAFFSSFLSVLSLLSRSSLVRGVDPSSLLLSPFLHWLEMGGGECDGQDWGLQRKRDSPVGPQTTRYSAGGVKQSYWGGRIASLRQEEDRVQPTQCDMHYHGKDTRRGAMSRSPSLIPIAESCPSLRLLSCKYSTANNAMHCLKEK